MSLFVDAVLLTYKLQNAGIYHPDTLHIETYHPPPPLVEVDVGEYINDDVDSTDSLPTISTCLDLI